MSDNKCSGYVQTLLNKELQSINCTLKTIDDSKYCRFHQYYETNNYTRKDIRNIKKNNAKFCGRIKKHLTPNDKKEVLKKNEGCDICKKIRIKQNEKKRLENVEENAKKKCEWYYDKEMKKCCYNKCKIEYCEKHKSVNKTKYKSEIEKCVEDENGKCKSLSIDYCLKHKYVHTEKYTDKMKEESIWCSTCHLVKYCNGYKTCDKCRDGKDVYRKKYKEKEIECLENECKYKARDNGYCGNHQKAYEKSLIDKDPTKKVCSNYSHNYRCVNALDINDDFQQCEDCRLYESIQLDQINYIKYKNTDDREKKQFDSKSISDEMILKLVSYNCFYCDGMNKRGFNGLDRVDNEKHYTFNNVVPCCVTCNMIKGKLSIDDFYTYCENIQENYPTIYKKTRKYRHHAEYGKFINNCGRRDKDVEITKDDYNNILKYRCYYCNNVNNPNQIGIDRLNNDIGYTLDNIKACCGECNIMKGVLSEDDFICQTKSIIKNKLSFNKNKENYYKIKYFQKKYKKDKKDKCTNKDCKNYIINFEHKLCYKHYYRYEKEEERIKNFKYTEIIRKEDNKCCGLTAKGKICGNKLNKSPSKSFCSVHIRYDKYTEDQLKHLSCCNVCRQYSCKGTNLTCDKCIKK